ncbi:MAG: hypothetical protein ABH817_00115 [archaeon]
MNKKAINNLEFIIALSLVIVSVGGVVAMLNIGSKEPIPSFSDIEEKIFVNYKQIRLDIDGPCFIGELNPEFIGESYTIDPLTTFSVRENWQINNGGILDVYAFDKNVVSPISNPESCQNPGEAKESIIYSGKMVAEDLIPENEDFQVVIDGKKFGREPPAKVEVFAKEILTKVIFENGRIDKTDVIIRRW